MTEANETCQYDYILERKKYERQKSEYLDRLPNENIFQLEEYEGFKLDRYFWDANDKRLIMITRGRYKYVNPTRTNGLYIVVLVDSDGKPHTCSFKRLYKELRELK